MTVIHASMNKMSYIHFSEKGPRMNNEDCCNIVEIAGKRTLFVLCDGMGGIIEKEKKGINTLDLFTEIVNILELPQNIIDSKIADFYTVLTTDKRFVMVDGVWDLRKHHTSDKIIKQVDDEDEEESFEEQDEDADMDDTFEEDSIDDNSYDDTDDDGLSDIVVLDEDEMGVDS